MQRIGEFKAVAYEASTTSSCSFPVRPPIVVPSARSMTVCASWLHFHSFVSGDVSSYTRATGSDAKPVRVFAGNRVGGLAKRSGPAF